MKAILHDLEELIKEMNAVDQMDDDLFIQYFEREEAMQERLEALKDANKLTAEEFEDYSGRLVEAFGRLKGKLFWKRAPGRCHAERSWAQRSNSWKQTLGIWILLRGFGHREALSGNVLLIFESCRTLLGTGADLLKTYSFLYWLPWGTN